MNVNYSKSCNIVMVAWSENRQKLFNLSLAPKFPTCRPFELLHFP